MTNSIIVFTLQDQVEDDTFCQIITNSNTINMFSFVSKAASYYGVPPTVKSMSLSVYIRTHFVGNNAFHSKLNISSYSDVSATYSNFMCIS